MASLWTLPGVVALAALALALPVLTVLGGRRRGYAWPLAAVAGVGFPVTWAVWYVADDRPYVSRRAS